LRSNTPIIDGFLIVDSFNKAGKVFVCYHDTGEIKQIANSFEGLIEDNFYE